MKAAQLTDIHKMKVREVPAPTLNSPDDVLIRIHSVGVCGSDIHYFSTGRIGSQVVQFPFTIGHECAGVVEEVADGATNVKPGDRVAIEPAVYCHNCDQCNAGRENTCRNLKFLGCPGQLSGALSEYLVMPEECCLKIPDNMSFEAAALCEPLAIGIYAARQYMSLNGKNIAILGAGPVGLSILLAALAEGADNVYVTDKLDYRVQAARENGAVWAGNPDKTDIVKEISSEQPLLLDAVFECCGRQEALDQGLELLKPGGRLMLVGIPEFDKYNFAADIARRKELCFQNVRRQNDCTEDAIKYTADRTIDTSFMATHHFDLDEIQKACELVENYDDKVIKAMIRL